VKGEREFLDLWQQAAPADRHGYVLNRSLILSVLLAVFMVWVLYTLAWFAEGFRPVSLIFFGAGWLLLSGLAVVQVLRVRLRGRASGVVLLPWGMVWKDGRRVEELRWEELRPESLEFQPGTGRLGRLEGGLDIRTSAGSKRLVVFTPFMRLDGLEGFFANVLTALKKQQNQ